MIYQLFRVAPSIANAYAALDLGQVLATASSPSVSNATVQHGPIALPKNMCGAYGTLRTYFTSAQRAS
jgi:hypothetical protein